jgi:hypothetical protein
MATETTYHCDCYENAEQDGQTEVLPRELLVRWRPDDGPVGAGRCYFALHPASPEIDHDTELGDTGLRTKRERNKEERKKKERRKTKRNRRQRKRTAYMQGRICTYSPRLCLILTLFISDRDYPELGF